MKIKNIDAYQVFDSRGNPTIEAEVELQDGTLGRAIVPSGASTGQFEALELRDLDSTSFDGKSVNRAIRNIRTKIAPELNGMDVGEQTELDKILIELDGTRNKSRLGANALVGVSMAVTRAAANSHNLSLYEYLGHVYAENAGSEHEDTGDEGSGLKDAGSVGSGHKDTGNEGSGSKDAENEYRGLRESYLLPLPEIQIIGGGAHSAGRIDIQDFMIICTGAGSYHECLEMTFHVYNQCGELLKKRGKLAGVADEGGYWPLFDRNEEVFDVLLASIENAGYRPGLDIHLSLDIAASEFFSDGLYHLHLDNRSLKPDAFFDLISGWCSKYPIISVEDPFSETDTGNWKRFTDKFGDKIQVVGDDLFTTDVERVRQGKQNGLANSVLIKLNQIGTVTETLNCIRQTQDYGWIPVISARSGETEDPFISHLAVATNAGQLKVGSFARSERLVKWNEVTRISRQLGNRARFNGLTVAAN